MEVFNNHQERSTRRHFPEKRDKRIEQTAAIVLRIEYWLSNNPSLLWQELEQCGRRSAQRLSKLLRFHFRAEPLQEIDHRRKRERAIRFEAVTLENLKSESVRPCPGLADEPRFPDPGFSGDEQGQSCALPNAVQVTPNRIEGGIAANDNRANDRLIKHGCHGCHLTTFGKQPRASMSVQEHRWPEIQQSTGVELHT
jgi:hypothetical protein